MRKSASLGADIAVIVAAVAVAALAVRQFLPASESGFTPPPPPGVGAVLDGEALGIDFTGQRTLIMVLASDCGYCLESMPFYRALLPKLQAVQVVVAAPPSDRQIGEYLAAERVEPDDIVFVHGGELPVAGTPTLLLADGSGVIQEAWLGLLNEERQQEVSRSLGL